MSLSEESISFAQQQGADLVGVVNLSRLDFPAGHGPEDYLPGAKSAVSIGYRLSKGSTLNLPQTRNGYLLEFETANQELNRINRELCKFFEEKGYLAFGVPGTASIGDKKRLAADLSHRHLAVAAGLAKFGVNNLVLTEEYGSRVRFTTVITTAELAESDLETEIECSECLNCVEICPVDALKGGQAKYSPDEGWRIAKERCYHQIFVKLNGKRCGLCIKACPLNK